MTIEKQLQEDKLTVKVGGRLDTNTAPELDAALKEDLDSINELTLDLTDLEYISSAGLRVLLSTQKVMGKKGGMTVTGVQDVVMDVLEVTGFADILPLV